MNGYARLAIIQMATARFRYTIARVVSYSPGGMLSYCTCAQEAASTKTQKEIWLVTGLKDHRYLSVTRMRHEDTRGLTNDRKETMNTSAKR